MSSGKEESRSVGADHLDQQSKGVVEHADPRRVEYETKSKEELIQILLNRDARTEQGCSLGGVDQLVEHFSLLAKTIHQACEKRMEEEQKRVRVLTDRLDVMGASLKTLMSETAQTRIQSSHRKVDAATSDMRAYSDSMTVMTYLNEESRTGIFTRTYGLQGIVAEIEEKRLLKARGIVSPDEDATQYPQQSKDDGTQCYIPGRGIIPPQQQATPRSGAEGKEDIDNPSGPGIPSTPDTALKRVEPHSQVSPGSTSEYNEPQEETTPHPKCDPKTVGGFFDYFKDEFLKEVAAKAIALKLTDKKFFPKAKQTTMEKLDDEGKANSMLLEHFQKHADYDMAVVLCNVMMEEPAYPKMNKLGIKMLAYLKAHPGMK